MTGKCQATSFGAAASSTTAKLLTTTARLNVIVITGKKMTIVMTTPLLFLKMTPIAQATMTPIAQATVMVQQTSPLLIVKSKVAILQIAPIPTTAMVKTAIQVLTTVMNNQPSHLPLHNQAVAIAVATIVPAPVGQAVAAGNN